MSRTETRGSRCSALLATISQWQDARLPWLLLAGISLFMLVVAHAGFQLWLYMQPCEHCVYIRLAFLALAGGGLVAAGNPRRLPLKLAGYALALWGAGRGVADSLTLGRIHAALRSDNPFGVQGCSADPHFPLELPLDRWFPAWFKPTGDCGYDSPIVPDGTPLGDLQRWLIDFYADGWYLWPKSHFVNMAEACLLIFALCLLLLALAALAWLVTLLRGGVRL